MDNGKNGGLRPFHVGFAFFRHGSFDHLLYSTLMFWSASEQASRSFLPNLS